MRYLFGFFMLFLVGCTQSEVLFPDTVNNPACVRARDITVVRVMQNYVLGWINDVNDPVVLLAQEKYQVSDPHFVFIPRQREGIYYPNQRITLDDSQCLAYQGAYRYQYNQEDGSFFVGYIVPSQVPSPES